jgi:hypothetical protein
MLSLRSLAFILYSAIRRARALSCAALHSFPDRITTMALTIGTNMLASVPATNSKSQGCTSDLLRTVYASPGPSRLDRIGDR